MAEIDSTLKECHRSCESLRWGQEFKMIIPGSILGQDVGGHFYCLLPLLCGQPQGDIVAQIYNYHPHCNGVV